DALMICDRHEAERIKELIVKIPPEAQYIACAMNPILGLDLGRARIGAAISDELQLLAHPLETIPANELAASRIAEIVQEKKIDHVVTGMPRQMNGQLGAAATEVIHFVE